MPDRLIMIRVENRGDKMEVKAARLWPLVRFTWL